MVHVVQMAQLWHTARMQLLGIFFSPGISSARKQDVAIFGWLLSRSLALPLSLFRLFANEWDTARAVK